jgi:hypothetical protein
MRPAPLLAPEKDGPLRLDTRGPRGTWRAQGTFNKGLDPCALAEGELLLLYVMATTLVVSDAIIVERQEEGHALKV